MILSCPQCNARFLVADRLIPPEGRVVKCGACSNQWHVDNPSPIAAAPEPEPTLAEEDIAALLAGIASPGDATEPTKNVPALATRDIPLKPLQIAFAALFGLWLVLASITYYPKALHAPVIRSVYSLFGIHSTDGLAFVDVKMERQVLETKTRFILTGDIINHAKSERDVPAVRVALKDKTGKPLWTRTYPVNEKVAPGARYPFRITNVETSFADSVTSITVDLGHSLQLSNR